MSRCLVPSIVLLALLGAAPPIAAQRRAPAHLRIVDTPAPELGVRAGYSWDLKAWSAGGRLAIPINRLVAIVPSGDYDFLDVGNQFELNLDLAFTPGRFRMFYLGGGLAYVHYDTGNSLALAAFNNKLGADVFLGVEPSFRRRSSIRPFGEVRWTFLNYGGSTNSTGRFLFGLSLVLGR